MDEEIKISISKRDLTYHSICFILIILAFSSGYYWGTHSTRTPYHSEKISIQHSEILLPKTTIVEASPQQTGEGVTSDSSWSNKLPQAAQNRDSTEDNTPRTETYRYYSIDSDTITPGSTLSSDHTTETVGGERAFVASKNGTKYYPANCKTASRIKAENRIYFVSEEEAELEGLTRTDSCK